MRTLAIANQKGGVGKTTTAVTLAADLARKGYITVLCDLDAQGNAAACLGLSPAPALRKLLMGMARLEDLLIEARPGLWFLAGDVTTARLKIELLAEGDPKTLLARALEPLECDFVVLDCGPSRDLLHDLAHHAAGEVVIPTACDFLAVAGVGQEMETLKIVRQDGHPIEARAVLPTFWDSQTIESRTNLQALADAFGPLVLPAVPRTTRLRELPAIGQTVWERLPEDSPVCEAYARLTRRVLDGQ